MTAALGIPQPAPLVPHPDLTAASPSASPCHRSRPRGFLASRQPSCTTDGVDGWSRHAVVKVETENPVGSFKGRGTWLDLCGGARASAGLRGADRPRRGRLERQLRPGVACAARAAGVGAVVFCDAAAGLPKGRPRIRSFGADLRLVGRDFDEARAASGGRSDPRSGD